MAVGIANCLESLEDLEDILKTAASIIKNGVWSNIFGLIDMVKDIADLIKELPSCMPELKDIDSKEAGLLVGRVYALIENVLKVFKA